MHTRFRLSSLVAGLVFLVAAGCGGDGGSLKEACEKGCATAATLKCPNDKPATCTADCEAAAHSVPNCKSQGEALIICAGNRPASDWHCDMMGESEVKDDVCAAEGQALLMCAFGGS